MSSTPYKGPIGCKFFWDHTFINLRPAGLENLGSPPYNEVWLIEWLRDLGVVEHPLS